MPDDIDEYWEHKEAAKKINGLYANQIYVQHLGSGLVRLNYGEVLDEEPRFHTAIVLTAENAYSFGELIMRVAAAAMTPQADQARSEAETPNGKR